MRTEIVGGEGEDQRGAPASASGGLVELLPWDTEFFGFPIGRVALDGATPATLVQIEDEARALGLRCLYGTLEPPDPVVACQAQEFGHILVEVGVWFTREPGPFPSRPTTSVAREATLEEVDALGPEIEVIGPWSRYGADPRFGEEAARRMLRAWLERAARDDDKILVVSEDADGYTGIGTAERGAETPNMNLIGVTKPGTGAAEAMMQYFLGWAGEGRTVHAGHAAARNVAVFRFVERCGFRSAGARYTFHRWFDDA